MVESDACAGSLSASELANNPIIFGRFDTLLRSTSDSCPSSKSPLGNIHVRYSAELLKCDRRLCTAGDLQIAIREDISRVGIPLSPDGRSGGFSHWKDWSHFRNAIRLSRVPPSLEQPIQIGISAIRLLSWPPSTIDLYPILQATVCSLHCVLRLAGAPGDYGA